MFLLCACFMHALILQLICDKLSVLYYYDWLAYVCYNIILNFSFMSISWSTLSFNSVFLKTNININIVNILL
jgi:hypothetical protein